MVNRVSSYFPKGGHSATKTELNDIYTRKVKRPRNSDSKTGNKEPQQNYRLGTVSNELLAGVKLVLRAQPHPQFLK